MFKKNIFYNVESFDKPFRLKMNYKKAVDLIFDKISHLINKIIKSTSQNEFSQYVKDPMVGQGKLSLIQLFNDLVKTEHKYVGYILDHTPVFCCQRESTCSENQKIIYW